MDREPLFHCFAGRHYTDQVTFDLEHEMLFSRMWSYAGMASSLTSPGDYFLTSIGNERLIVLMDSVHKIRAFYNVCSHHGSTLCSEEKGHLKGSIQCRYHAFTFGLDGSLLHARYLPPEYFDHFDLIPIHLQVWEGMIFVNLSGEPEPLIDQLYDPQLYPLGLNAPVHHYHLETLVSVHRRCVEIQANWKIIVQNEFECFHCACIHPQLGQSFPGVRDEPYRIDYDGYELDPRFEVYSTTGLRRRPDLPDLTSHDRRRYDVFYLSPLTFVHLFPDHALIFQCIPLAPDRTMSITEWLFDRDEAKKEGFDPAEVIPMMSLLNDQDKEICERVQENMSSKLMEHGGTFIPYEQTKKAFYSSIIERCQGRYV